MLNSGVANYNLVKISSILPANAKQKSKIDLVDGSVLYAAYASKSSNKKGETVSAAVAVGIPANSQNIGTIMEFSGFCDKTNAEKIVKEMVVEAMNIRGYDIKDILFASAEACGDGEKYVTAFATLAIW